MVKVWFNHWFSTAHQIIRLLKEDDETEFHVTGTNQRVYSVIRNACDEWYEEPVLSGEEYVKYCLEFCEDHEIEVFAPRREMVEISRARARFAGLGVKLLVDEFDKIALLNQKAETYRLFQDNPLLHVPDYSMAGTEEEFRAGYQQLKERHESVCMKLAKDEGGMSFRIITDGDGDPWESLCRYPGSRISYDSVQRILSEKGTFPSLMLMPYLPGDEISVDCLRTDQGLIAIPRIKGPWREERIEFDERILAMCREILRTVPLNCPCNIQFKMSGTVPYLLEINTRMSGGVAMSCLAAGVNIPNLAVNQLLGRQKSWSMDQTPKIVSYTELPQIIQTVIMKNC